ncbi:hypothetical protein ACRAWD_02630 [Caulobacter segnis]
MRAENSRRVLADAFFDRKLRPGRWTKAHRRELEETVAATLGRLKIVEPAGPIADAFIERDFVSAVYNRKKVRQGRARAAS